MNRYPSFAELAQLEPDLSGLLREIRSLGGARTFCASAVWYEPVIGFKERLSLLVGWKAHPGAPEPLRTPEAYDVAYHSLVAALPPCRGRACDCDPSYIQRASAKRLEQLPTRTS